MSNSIEQLADRLASMEKLLRKHRHDFGGKVFNKKASTFSGQAEKFQATLDDFAAGFAPGMRELTRLAESPDKKILTKPTQLSILYKKALGRSPKAADGKTAAAQFKSWLKVVKDQALGEKGLIIAQEVIGRSKVKPKPLPQGDEAMRLELNRLGGLSDEDLDIELDIQFKKIGDLKKLAKANGVKLPPKVARAQIIKAIKERARRVHSHIL